MHNTYLFQHSVRAAAYLFEDISVNGIVFSNYKNSNSHNLTPNLIIAQIQNTEATNFIDAINNCRKIIIQTIDAMSVYSQCAFSTVGCSWFLKRRNYEDDISYIHVARSSATVAMPLQNSDVSGINSLISSENSTGLYFFRQANNASTLEAQVTMLIIAAEAFAGIANEKRHCHMCGYENSISITNRNILKQILSDDLYRKLYKKGGALRHKLLHGSQADFAELNAIRDPLHNCVLSYLKNKHALSGVNTIIAAPRPFTSFESAGTFIKVHSSTMLTLEDLELQVLSLLEDNQISNGVVEIINPIAGY